MQATFHTRRATADDVPQLRQLWHHIGLPAAELEKCFTEFQLAEDADGRILGALGLRMEGKHGWLHSETFADFALTDTVRPLLWQRITTVAGSYGLARLWTTENAPYWRHQDFVASDEEVSKRRPAIFGTDDQRWLTLKLREEIDVDQYLEKEFMMFKSAEAARNQQLLGQAKAFKTIAAIIALVTLVLTSIGLFYLIRRGGFGPH